MTNHLNLIAFGTFGNPNGFKQSFFWGSNELAKFVKTFDLNTNAIRVFSNSKIYSIRKEFTKGFSSLAYSLYTYAKEQNSDRSGTFIGCSLLFTGKISNERITIEVLNEFHSNLIKKNTQNDVIMVNHSDNFDVVPPKLLAQIESNLVEVENLNFLSNSGKVLVVFTPVDDDTLCRLYSKSIDLLNIYDVIYFTNSREVAEFVNQKGIFKIIQNVEDKLDFDFEYQELVDERKKRKDKTINDFEKEVQRLNEGRLNTISDFKRQIEQNERTHRENELRIDESKRNLEKIDQFYNEFSNRLQDLVNQLKEGKKLEVVKELHNENKNRFVEGLVNFRKPNYIDKLPKIYPRSNLKPEINLPKSDERYKRYATESPKVQKESWLKQNVFKISSFTLLIVLLLSWIYFLFFQESNVQSRINASDAVGSINLRVIDQTSTANSLPPLNPTPNGELNENDYRVVARKLAYRMSIDDVVKIIFDNNPTDIRNHYLGQEGSYSEELIQLNENCFEAIENIMYFNKDTLRHIPSYIK